MVPVLTACHAVARTPRCMLWLDITEEGTLVCCLIARLTPTRDSPLSPVRTSYGEYSLSGTGGKGVKSKQQKMLSVQTIRP